MEKYVLLLELGQTVEVLRFCLARNRDDWLHLDPVC
jgi:hypothetical protein